MTRYASKANKDVSVAEYLFIALVNFFTRLSSQSSQDYIQTLCSVIKISKDLGKVHEPNLMDLIAKTSLDKSIKSIADFKKLQGSLSSDEFNGVLHANLLSKIAENTLKKIDNQGPPFVYSEPNQVKFVLM